MVQYEHELPFADGSKVANARAVQTVLTHSLELSVEIFLGHSERRIGALLHEGRVGRAEGAGVLVHPGGSAAAPPVPQIGDLAAHLRQLIPEREEVAHRVLQRTRSTRAGEEHEPEDGRNEELHRPEGTWARRVPARPRSIRAIETELRLDDLVANRTMSPEIAGTLREVARGKRSFIVVAVPRLAGKSTVLRAILAERPPSTPVTTVAEDGDDVAQLVKKTAGGYLVIPEITQSAAMPGYIWGADVRRIFTLAKEGVALAATLHAEGPNDAFAQICGGCGVPDADAAKISLVVSLRSIGRWEEPTRRVVQAVHEIEGVRDGKPRAKLLHRWDEQHDLFS
jgi:hypothetical protein